MKKTIVLVATLLLSAVILYFVTQVMYQKVTPTTSSDESISVATNTFEDESISIATNSFEDESISVTTNSFEIVKLGESSYLPPESENNSNVQWQYIRSTEHLEKLMETFKFKVPNNMNLENHSYIVSFGCEIIEMWTEEKVGEDHVLSVVYSDMYYDNQIFLYELPLVRIYPFKWPSYILKDGEVVPFATDPNNYDVSLLEGYK